MRMFERTENGYTSLVSVSEGLREISCAQMDGRKNVRKMSADGRCARIEYKNGDVVTFRRVDVDEPAPNR